MTEPISVRTAIILLLCCSLGSSGSLTVIAVGDIMMGSDFPADRLPPEQGRHLPADVAGILGSADLTLGNLEGTLLEGGVCAKNPARGKVYAFRTPPEFAANLAGAGFDILNLANNHMNDFGPGGVEATKQTLLAHAIQFAGPGGATATIQLGRVAVADSADSNVITDTVVVDESVRVSDGVAMTDTVLIGDSACAADSTAIADSAAADDQARLVDSAATSDTPLVVDTLLPADSTEHADRGTRADSLSIAVASFATSPGADLIFDIAAAQSKVARLARENDVVIVSFHGGAEGRGCLHTGDTFEYFLGTPRGNVVAFARAVIDSGADLVWGHGPHVPRAMELYKDRLIAYSLGNFCTYGFNTSAELGYAPMLKVVLDTAGVFMHGQIISAAQGSDGLVRIDTLHRAARLIRRLSAEDFPRSSLLITDDGRLRPVGGQPQL